MMHKLNQVGIFVCLVTKPSRKPAIIKTGISPTAIFIPSLAPLRKDSTGNKFLEIKYHYP